jgi:hypothetical protein
MPEISMFLDRDDEHSLIQFILTQGGRLVGDLQPSPDYKSIADCDTFSTVRSTGRLFFVLFDSFEESPLRLKRINDGCNSGKYYVMQRVGGPVINLLVSALYRKDNLDWVSGGGLSYYSTYENTITGEMEKPPEALVEQFKFIVSYLKERSKSIVGQSGRKYLIGPHTYQSILEGKLKLGVEGLIV